MCVVRTFATLLLTSTTRYGRPNTLCSAGVKLIGPPSVWNFVSFARTAASFAPSVEPPVCLIA